jgi:hypothetical protein
MVIRNPNFEDTISQIHGTKYGSTAPKVREPSGHVFAFGPERIFNMSITVFTPRHPSFIANLPRYPTTFLQPCGARAR